VNTTGEQAQDEERTAAALVTARRLLVTGFAAAPVETAALACDLAEALGAAVDPGDIDCGQVAGPTIARIGTVTADPGELRDRADLVVFWFCPTAEADAFRAAFVTPAIATGRTRRVLAVGPTAAAPEGHVAVPRDDAFDLARVLHAAAAGIACPSPAALTIACDTLRAACTAAGCIAFVTHRDDPTGLESWSLTGLVRALAHHQPAFEVPLATGAGAAAAVCTWRYGAAGAIARADRDGAVFLPAECDAVRLIARGEVDAVVAAGPLPDAVEAAIAAQGQTLTVIRADDQSLPRLLAAVRAARAAEGRP
jgi:formylmethanofuran dehydrogenase subunit B